MYEYRLWIELSESTEESDCGQLEAKILELQALINEKLTLIRSPTECIFHVNYCDIFQCSAGTNHRGRAHEDLLEVLEHLIKILPGSHGLVYWVDDEDPGASYFDGYRVLVIARGQIHERFDPFLSPLTPVVED